ncbi:FecR domain-containing protein [Parabacteroides sp. OttesenSCG-928-G06]|nr:FecR domain-containing protein [Parabacteroides sp. OttesenSCG-928-K15]MDL2282332.1 FecR domain-containing protein [Parabacteroides sp. OttesenSCG-928-G06]
MFTIGRNNFDKWELLLRVLSEEIPESDQSFQNWLQEDEKNRELFQSLKEGEMPDVDATYNAIAEKLSFNHKDVPFYKKKWFQSVAAVAILLLSIPTIYFATLDRSQPEQIVEEESDTLFNPGTKKAYLLSSEGESIDLSETFQMAREDGTVISNDAQGVVRVEKEKKEKKKSIEDHTIYVPKGGEYMLILADGTRVYLNSETRLTFPSDFVGKERKVSLTGEAYFEVKKGRRPFIVETEDMQVEVLGTSFNVNAYQDNASVHTTLVEGSVRVHLPDNPNVYELQPEKNLSIDKLSGKISVKQVDTQIYVAWIKGKFYFRRQPLHEILVQLQRWYDFEVVYDDPVIQHLSFSGSAEKSRPLDYLLNQIQEVTDVKYKKEGGKIIFY